MYRNCQQTFEPEGHAICTRTIFPICDCDDIQELETSTYKQSLTQSF